MEQLVERLSGRSHPATGDTAFRRGDFEPALSTRLLVLQPTPFCNIRCSYCYLPDRDDRSRMTLAVALKAVQRLVDDGLLADRLTVIWHAGEPLAVPRSFYDEAIPAIGELVAPHCRVTHALQTNAMLVDDEWCALFLRHGVRIGVSIDGPAFLHDAHRLTRRGHGTHARVMKGIERLSARGVPFHAIAVVTAQALPHADAFADFFETIGATELGCNFDEAEGGHSRSSVQGQEPAHRAFLARLFERAAESNGRLQLRERTQALRRLAGASPPMSWRGIGFPDNAQVWPFAIVNVAWNGDFGCFSPELLGFAAPGHGGFTLGNVSSIGYLESAAREPFIGLWGAIRRGIEVCRHGCVYFDHCGGGAPVNKLCENGDMASGETLYCRSMVQRPIELVLAQAQARLHSAAATEA